ncbi:MAG: DnaJ domain-containing protein [bacterium]|nr:DnaJ domain-containing protein [bacterium]
MISKDYYNILGIRRDADTFEIQRAYTRRMRELHPDRSSSNPEADKKIGEVGEAYRVLSDPQKRQQYDLYGSVGGDYAPPPGWQAAARSVSFNDLDPTFFDRDNSRLSGFDVMLYEILNRFNRRSQGANGSHPFQENHDRTRGSDVEVELRLSLTDLYDSKPRLVAIAPDLVCEDCGGTGHSAKSVCAKCAGAGHFNQNRTLNVKIPPGVENGEILKLFGQGNPAPKSMGPSGDLRIRIKIDQSDGFSNNGRDLLTELPIPDYLAALGGVVALSTPSGSLILRLAAGSNSGKKLKISGKGLPRREGGFGDLIVTLLVIVPDQLTIEQKQFYEALKKLNQ